MTADEYARALARIEDLMDEVYGTERAEELLTLLDAVETYERHGVGMN